MFTKISIILRKLLFLLVFTLFVVFIFANRGFVEINLVPFGYKMRARIFLIIIMSFFAGVVFEYFCNTLSLPRIVKKISDRRKMKNMERELKKVKSNEGK